MYFQAEPSSSSLSKFLRFPVTNFVYFIIKTHPKKHYLPNSFSSPPHQLQNFPVYRSLIIVTTQDGKIPELLFLKNNPLSKKR